MDKEDKMVMLIRGVTFDYDLAYGTTPESRGFLYNLIYNAIKQVQKETQKETIKEKNDE